VPDLVLADAARCAVYVEAECRADDEPDVMARWSALLDGSGALVDLDGGVLVAVDATQRERFRAARHAVPAGVNERAAQNGMPKLGTDLAVPAAHVDEMLELYRRAASDPWGLLGVDERAEVLSELGVRRREDAPLPEALDTVTFGHIGDGHVHVNFLPVSAAGLVLARAVYAHLTDAAIAFGGSPSAEHGIGKIKHDALRALVGEEGIAQMRAVKCALDPTGGLGRGNLFTP
jgi:D-lactate dehydrogenase (cytochrome)